MFDAVTHRFTDSACPDVVAELTGLVDRLGALPAAADDAERIDRIAALERLRGAVAAAQARETTAFAASQVAAQRAAGVPEARRGRGVPEQIGFARRMSPAAAARQVTFAKEWLTDLPAVFNQLRAGRISEWAAQVVAQETRDLPRYVRRSIAADLAPDLPGMSIRQVQAAARQLSYAADPAAVLGRARTARSDRRVGIRPAPDTMAVLSAVLPAEQGVATWANLDRHARALRATGDPRSIAQLMADTLVERVTGQSTASAIPVEIGLTISADSLLGHDKAPADLRGYGPVPTDVALDLAGQAAAPTGTPAADNTADADDTDDAAVAVWVRRVVTDPIDDTVVHVDTKRRRFDGALARLIKHRDQVCRDPFCTAPVRHLDHVRPYRDGGPTSAANGAGLCERGNYVKDMPGWSRRVISTSGGTGNAHRQVIEVTTPTGHRYISPPPPALGPGSNRLEQDRRRAIRRQDFLRRERLIASLPSAGP
ncbi:MAG: DUF222 domain-containing protein [Kribbellaceae bacterium]